MSEYTLEVTNNIWEVAVADTGYELLLDKQTVYVVPDFAPFDHEHKFNDLQDVDISTLPAGYPVLWHNDASGVWEPHVMAFGDLSDVTVTSPTDGSVLRYDAASGAWVEDGTVNVIGSKVGINIVPSAALDVNGQFRVMGTGAPTSGAGVEIYYTSGIGKIFAYDRDTGTSKDLLLGDIAYIYLAANGNTGIKTTTPINTLDVAGGIAIGAGYAGTYAAPSNGLIVDGDVSIGTFSSLGAKLDVNGQFRVMGTGAPTSGAGVEIYYTSGIGKIFAYDRDTGTSQNLILGTNTNLYLAANGNVAVKHSSPSGILDVNGDIVVHEITTPAVPSVDSARIFARDDGTGLTEIGLQFNTGGVQVLGKQGYTVPAYTTANITTTRSLDASTATVADVANVLGTLIEDMRARGWFN